MEAPALVGRKGNLIPKEVAREYALKRGLCPQCTRTVTHRREGRWNKKFIPIDRKVDENGVMVVYKGYCLQPSCNTLYDVRKLLRQSVLTSSQSLSLGRNKDDMEWTDCNYRDTTLSAFFRRKSAPSLPPLEGCTMSVVANLKCQKSFDMSQATASLEDSEVLSTSQSLLSDRAQLLYPSRDADFAKFPITMNVFEPLHLNHCTSGFSEPSSSSNDEFHDFSVTERSIVEEMREAAHSLDFTLLLSLLERHKSNALLMIETFQLLCKYISKIKQYVFANDNWMKSVSIAIEQNQNSGELQIMAASTFSALSATCSHYTYDIVKHGGGKILLSMIKQFKTNKNVVDSCCCALFCLIERRDVKNIVNFLQTGLLFSHEPGAPILQSLIEVIEIASVSGKAWIFCSILNFCLQNLSHNGRSCDRMLHESLSGKGINSLISVLKANVNCTKIAGSGLQLLMYLASSSKRFNFFSTLSMELFQIIHDSVHSDDSSIIYFSLNLFGIIPWKSRIFSERDHSMFTARVSTVILSHLSNEDIVIAGILTVNRILVSSKLTDLIPSLNRVILAILKSMEAFRRNLKLQKLTCNILSELALRDEYWRLVLLDLEVIQVITMIMDMHWDQHSLLSIDFQDFWLCCTQTLVNLVPIISCVKDFDIDYVEKIWNHPLSSKLPVNIQLYMVQRLSQVSKFDSEIEGAFTRLFTPFPDHESELWLSTMAEFCKFFLPHLMHLIGIEPENLVMMISDVMKTHSRSLRIQDAGCDVVTAVLYTLSPQEELKIKGSLDVPFATGSLHVNYLKAILAVKHAMEEHSFNSTIVVKAYNAFSQCIRYIQDFNRKIEIKGSHFISEILKPCIDCLCIHYGLFDVLDYGLIAILNLLLICDQGEMDRYCSYIINAVIKSLDNIVMSKNILINACNIFLFLFTEVKDPSGFNLIYSEFFALYFLSILLHDDEDIVEATLSLIEASASRFVTLKVCFLQSGQLLKTVMGCMHRFPASIRIQRNCSSLLMSLCTLHEEYVLMVDVDEGGTNFSAEYLESYQRHHYRNVSSSEELHSLTKLISIGVMEEVKHCFSEIKLLELRSLNDGEILVAEILDVLVHLCSCHDWLVEYLLQSYMVEAIFLAVNLFIHDLHVQSSGSALLGRIASQLNGKENPWEDAIINTLLNAMLAHIHACDLQIEVIKILTRLSSKGIKEHKNVFKCIESIIIVMKVNYESEDILSIALIALNALVMEHDNSCFKKMIDESKSFIVLALKKHKSSSILQSTAIKLSNAENILFDFKLKAKGVSEVTETIGMISISS
jgi:hypothetical protein